MMLEKKFDDFYCDTVFRPAEMEQTWQAHFGPECNKMV